MATYQLCICATLHLIILFLQATKIITNSSVINILTAITILSFVTGQYVLVTEGILN